MQKSVKSSQSAASAETPAAFSPAAASSARPPVATFRQYLDGPAEAFEMARRQAVARPRPGGGAPDADARRLFIF